MPNPFRSIEFRGIRWQIIHFQPGSICFEPCPNILVLVITGIILYVINTMWIIITSETLFQKGEIAVGIEHGSTLIQESRAVDIDAAEDLDTVARTGNRNERLAAFP